MIIQYILIIAIVLIVLRLIYQLKNKNISFTQFWGWLAIWAIAILIIGNPQITTYIAAKVGIGRGVDLVVYVSIIILFYAVFRLLLRLEKLEKQLTQTVRQDALKNVFKDEAK
jgi:hypothetical protein